MSFTIKNQSDVFKFALPLHDYLAQHGYDQEAEGLAELADSCYPDDEEALDAHRSAFRQIRGKVADLPPQYLLALDDALEILSDDGMPETK